MKIIVITAFVIIALIVIAYLLAQYKAARFRSECIYIQELINRSEITGKAYDDINNALNDMDCLSKTDEMRKRSLWASFQWKFKSISPYRVEQ